MKKQHLFLIFLGMFCFIIVDEHIASTFDISGIINRLLVLDPWIQEQMRRRQRVDNVCKLHSSKLLAQNMSLTHLSFIPQYNLLYCRIQKSGTTNWIEGTFERLAPKLGLKEYSSQSRAKKLAYFEVENMEKWNQIVEGDPVSFVNVRHPFERLVSGYLDKAPGGEYGGWKDKTFPQFVNIVLMQAKRKQDMKYAEIDVHWRPYNAHCFFCNVKYTVISKMETYDEDKSRFLEMVGLEEEDEKERMHVHGGDQITELTKELFKSLSKEDKTELANLYRYELDLFDYDPFLY